MENVTRFVLCGTLLALAAAPHAGRAGVCEDAFPPLAEQGVCGNYTLNSVEVCACPVSTGGDLGCGPLAPGALLSAHRISGDVTSYGTWPPAVAAITDEAALRLFATKVGPSADLDVHVSALQADFEGSGGWDELDIVFSPEGEALAVGARDVMGASFENTVSLVRCDTGGGGWSIERALPATVWLARWGLGAPDERVLYFADRSLYRLVMDREAVVVEDGGGQPVEALVMRRLELLARKPDHDDGQADVNTADMDVVFPAGEDTYLAFLEGEMGQGFEVLSRILLTDLGDCDFVQCEAQAWDYCCKTALIAEYGPLTPNPWTGTAVTNPAMNHDGSILTFHWDSLVLFDVPANYSILYLVSNPMMDGSVPGSCTEVGTTPGFSEALDCLDMLGDDGAGRPNCPNYHHCGEQGVDCSRCVSIGRIDPDPDADDGSDVRNLTSFFHLDGGEYMAVERYTYGRDGEGGPPMAWLDIYAIPAQGLELPGDADGWPLVLETATDLVPYDKWHPSAVRRAPGDDDDGDDDDTAAGDDDGGDDDADDDGADDDAADDDGGDDDGDGPQTCECRCATPPPAGVSPALRVTLMVGFLARTLGRKRR